MVMHILVAPAEFSFRAGNYHVTYNLVKRIGDKHNVKFCVLASKIDESAKKELNNHELHELNTSLLLYPLKVWMYGKKLVKRFDIIHHISPFAVGKDFNLLALTANKPFVIGPVEIPHRFFEDEFKFLRIPVFAKLFRESRVRQELSAKTLERCDVAIAVNNQTKRALENFIEKEKIKTIPIGVDTEIFSYTRPTNNHNILAVGVHIKRKGFDYLIEALFNVVKEFPDVRLHLTSVGPRTEHLKKLVGKLNLSKNVVFWGRVDDKKLLELYSMCRIFVHSSLSEGFCHTTLEAMAVGRPVVSTKTAGSEMVEHGKTGFLVPPADSEALADAILKLLSDYNLACRMGKKAREIVEEKYDWNVVVEKYYNTYQDTM
jgi:glycosyltransferase involved in cell wall biosynthesis